MSNIKNKFNVNDRVTTKCLGLPTTGTVVGVVDANLCQPNSPTWNENYPLWQDGYVNYVEFDEPQKQFSFEEFLDLSQDVEFSQSTLKEIYLNSPEVKICLYPEDDLEML